MDRGGNMVSKIPSNALSQVKFKGRKIIIPYNGKRYVIVRCKNDNEKDVNITVRQSRQSGVARATCPD